MRETLDEYCLEHPLENEMDKDTLLNHVGGIDSPYYAIVMNLTKTLILDEPDKKRRCLVWHGVTNSGKTTIAN